MEQRRIARAGQTGDPRENLPTSDIVRHDSYMRKSRGATPPGIEPGSPRPNGGRNVWRHFHLSIDEEVELLCFEINPRYSAVNRHVESFSLALFPGTSASITGDSLGIGCSRIFAESIIEARYRRQDCTPVQCFARRGDERVVAHVSVAPSAPTLLGLTKYEVDRFFVGATVAERLARFPPTKANRAQSTAGSSNFRKCWSVGSLGDLPFPLPPHSDAAPHSPQSPSSALKTSIVFFVLVLTSLGAQVRPSWWSWYITGLEGREVGIGSNFARFPKQFQSPLPLPRTPLPLNPRRRSEATAPPSPRPPPPRLHELRSDTPHPPFIRPWLVNSPPTRRTGFIPGGVTPEFSHEGIVRDDAAGRRVLSGIFRFLRHCISALLHTRLALPPSALKSSLLRATQISSLTHFLWVGPWGRRAHGLSPKSHSLHHNRHDVGKVFLRREEELKEY
ncbi:hypothetical protein PR048_006366 [Dryococelus australis]|uniref:Uncharacterized protein n=1 Tax=Dryococelus australis TaxID=614101 RepID=A0ABQ9IBT2_9NEOP|nr:hypothetical protein PR048_006366 [Dryococelus australis]